MSRCFCNCGQWFWSKARLREHIALHNLSIWGHASDHWEVSKAHHMEYLVELKERKSMGQ